MTTSEQLLTSLAPLQATHTSLENESHNHHGYVEGKESHFKLTIVSDHFAGIGLVKRHQAIYALAQPFLTANGGSIHALAIHAYTTAEWDKLGTSPDSPLCAGKRA